MPIIASILYRDTKNFFLNQWTNIILVSIITALINFSLNYVLSPGNEQLVKLNDITDIVNVTNMTIQKTVQNLSLEQQQILLRASAAGTLASLFSNVILIGGLLTMIRLISNHQPINILHSIILSTPRFPTLLLIIFISTLLVELGLLVLIIPGILFAIAFSLAPVIAISDNLGVIHSMRLSMKLSVTHLKIIAPSILLWLLAKSMVLLFATQLSIIFPSILVTIVANGLSNFISALLFIYLYRLYMLLSNKVFMQ